MSNIGPMLEALASDPLGAAAYEALLQSLAAGRARAGHPGEPVLLGFYGGGRLAAGSVLGRVMVTVRSVVPAFRGSLAAVGTPPASPATFTITLRRAGQEQTIGQLTFDTSGNPRFQLLPVGARSVRLEPGDVISVIAPATQDPQLADVNVVIRALPWEDARSQPPRRGLAQNTQAITLVAPAPYNQDLIPDGTVYLRMPGSNMDANRRALVDFSQTGHVNKTLDYVGDGSTYLRVPAGNLDSNRRALIDFSQTGHVNKTLDYVGDGSTYLRVPASNLDSNRRALIDFSQTGHVNKIGRASCRERV